MAVFTGVPPQYLSYFVVDRNSGHLEILLMLKQ